MDSYNKISFAQKLESHTLVPARTQRLLTEVYINLYFQYICDGESTSQYQSYIKIK